MELSAESCSHTARGRRRATLTRGPKLSARGALGLGRRSQRGGREVSASGTGPREGERARAAWPVGPRCGPKARRGEGEDCWASATGLGRGQGCVFLPFSLFYFIFQSLF